KHFRIEYVVLQHCEFYSSIVVSPGGMRGIRSPRLPSAMVTPWTGNSLSLVNVISVVKKPPTRSQLCHLIYRRSPQDNPSTTGQSPLCIGCLNLRWRTSLPPPSFEGF